jgi:putative ATP-dependent endonuclease of OLD family
MNILIDTIRIAGFRGIKNLEVSLPRVTVLIGTNSPRNSCRCQDCPSR